MQDEILYINNSECPFCKSNDLLKYQQRADQLWVLLCNNCQLGFVEKYPKNLQDLYDIQYYEKSQDNIDLSIGYSNYQEIGYDYFIWAIALVALTKSKGSLFDLGCSNGLFLDLAKSYGCTDLAGVELTPEYAEICRQKGYDAYNIDFLDIEFKPEQKYDIVTAWAVLEHIPQLNKTLEKIKTILKEDGVLFFEVPCLTFSENDKYWLNSSLEHIYYFTEKSFNSILKKFFGNLYIGRVVDYPNYGSSLVGFVTSSKSKLIDFHAINAYLHWINKADMEYIEVDDLINYFIFHFRYTANIQVCKNIEEYLNKNLFNVNYIHRIDIQYWTYISTKLIKAYLDNQDYIEAKEYFLSQISSLQSDNQCNLTNLQQTQSELQQTQSELQQTQSELQQTQSELQQTQSELQQTQSELQQTQSELQQTQSELQQTQSELQQTRSELQQTRSELQQIKEALVAINTSKFWQLRTQWFRLRKVLGFKNDDAPIGIKALSNNKKNLDKNLLASVNKTEETESNIKIEIIEQKLWDRAKPLISVVIPCFNYGEYIEEAIDSVLNQTFQDFEIIVVDGGSTDKKTITKLESLHKSKTKIYYRKSRHFVGSNRNFGINKSQGKYICCLDADDKIKPTYLEKALFLLEVHGYDIVSTSVQCFGRAHDIWPINQNPTLEQIVQANQISTVAVFSKEMWKKASGYHDYGIGETYISEDWDLWVRMMAIGARVVNICEPLMLYRIHNNHASLSNHPETISLNEQAKVISSFNKKYLTEKAYEFSRNKNQLSYQLINGDINLNNSYLKRSKEKIKKNILFALPFVITGGADTILLQIVEHLHKNNFDVSVMTTIQTDTEKFGDNTNKYEKITKSIYHLYNFITDQNKWKEFIYYHLRSRKVDIIFIVGSVYFYEILPDIKKNFPHIRIVDQLFNEHGHINNNRKFSQLIDMNILASQIIQDILIRDYQELEQKTRVIVHGVDTQTEFNPINIIEELTREIIPKDKFIVSFMGRFSEEKCPNKFIDIVDKLRDHENIYFLMLGNGPEYEQIKQKISELQLQDKIYAPGFVDDNKPFLKATDVIIIPSRIEGIPIILMEGLSLGVPVIASNIGGIPDIITDGYNGFICDPNNIDDFINKILQIYSDKNLREQLKTNARNYAEKNLDFSKMNSEYLNIFLSLVNNN